MTYASQQTIRRARLHPVILPDQPTRYQAWIDMVKDETVRGKAAERLSPISIMDPQLDWNTRRLPDVCVLTQRLNTHMSRDQKKVT